MWSCGQDRPDLSYFPACLSCLKTKTKQKSWLALARKKRKERKRKKENKNRNSQPFICHVNGRAFTNLCDPPVACYHIDWAPTEGLSTDSIYNPGGKTLLLFSFFFVLLQKRVCKKGPSGRASKAHRLVLLITPLFVLIMAASRMFLFRNTILPHQMHLSTVQM